ncbi:hypothetical protein AB0C04_28120 [Micromonospora sp. NPDC048909]|uniref:hypothetical protein n=1 Tax=Micromonospora sp. NPDC048909 TaxID=3155643 RepID=UPI0033C33BC1
MEIAAVVISGVALVVSVWGVWHSKRSADASERSANAAERQARAAEAAVPPPPPPVAWKVEQRGKSLFVLRNVGTETADGVYVHKQGGFVRVEENGRTLQPGESMTFVVIRAAGMVDIQEIRVSWDGQVQPVMVPLP